MKTYSLDDFSKVTSADLLVKADITMGELPSIEDVKVLGRWNQDMLQLYNVTGEFARSSDFDRSGALTKMAYYGAEMGWDDRQIMRVLIDLDDRWGKYSARRDRENRYLIPLINRARAKIGYNPEIGIDVSSLPTRGKGEASIDTEQRLVWGFQDFVDADFPINWMLEGLMAEQGMGYIVGFPGVGKTQLAFQFGCQLALGEEKWLKWKNVGGKKKVLFLSLEMGPAPARLFAENIIQTYEDRRTLNRNMMIAPIGEPVALDTEPGQQLLRYMLEEHHPDLLIIDSLQAVSSKELTDELAAKSLVATLKTFRRQYGCSMLILHHQRKKQSEQQKRSVEQSDMYGSQFLIADAEFILSLRQGEEDDLLHIDNFKNRLGPTMSSFEVARDEHLHFSLDVNGILGLDTERKEPPRDPGRGFNGFNV